MKKKLEAELISIAHRILKLKNKSEIVQLHQETQKLYEKLTVLRFVEEHFSEAKPTIGKDEIFEKVMHSFDDEVGAIPNDLEVFEEKEIIFEAIVPVEEASIEEALNETLEAEYPVEEAVFESPEAEEVDAFQEAQKEAYEDAVEMETAPEVAAFEPNFEMFKDDEVLFDKPKKSKEAKQISFEDLLGGVHEEPVFERIETAETTVETTEILEVSEETIPTPLFELDEEELDEEEMDEEEMDEEEEVETSLLTNDSFKKGISFGLNDRIAFEKNLFGGSSEDLNRVISQLSSFDSFEEAQEFIEDMVKPDYDNWEGKEEYVQRFMDVVEKKFA